ncbi:MAG: recombinase family protein [Pseudomonadota bacterium]
MKGIEGRLKQGLFPFAAPIGYLDQGAGKPKALDPERAPYVRQAFELYATQQYSLRGLLAELRQRGFRNRSGKPITKGCLEILLSNRFYHGEIIMKRSGRRYKGVHEPIITRSLFRLVQELKSDRQHKKQTRHNHTYRRLITCGACQRNLIGELQKGRVYMRCHTKGCPGKSIRVDQVEAEIGSALGKLEVSEKDYQVLRTRLREHINKHNPEANAKALELQMSSVDARLEKLTDALLDGLIDKETFQQRKERLVDERQQLEENRAKVGSVDLVVGRVEKFLELVKSLSLTYEIADPTKKRRIAEVAFSNRILIGKYLVLEPQNWL